VRELKKGRDKQEEESVRELKKVRDKLRKRMRES
jgi:hypothetical protein